MALNFPDNPSVNDVYRDSTSGFAYQWDGTVWQSYSDSSLGQIQVLDDISGSFNSSTQTFALTSSSTAITPANAQQIRVVLGGIVQDPADDYTVSGSNITFTTPPAGGLSFSGVVFGTAFPISTIVDGTVTEGSLRISTKAVVGAATTFTEDLVVNGSARVVGVLTVGTSSLTLNGDTNQINGVTISSGIITASSFFGDGSGLTGVGIGSTGDINTTGIITASSFFGDGSGLTGVGIGATSDLNTTGIGTFGTVVATDELDIPDGTTAERPVAPVTGSFRYNSDYNTLEFYTGTVWIKITLQDYLSGDIGVFGGDQNTIDYITIATTGNAIDFGDLTVGSQGLAACSSSTRGVFGGGANPGVLNIIDYITFANDSNATDFGDLTVGRYTLAACSSSTRGVFGGGLTTTPTPTALNTIDYITIATTGNATDFGDLTVARLQIAACSSSTRGVFGGGSSPSLTNTIDYITIATTGNATDFGDLTEARHSLAACSSSTRGVFGGGFISPITNTIDYITIATTGNATDFGDLTVARFNIAACSSSTRGVFGGGGSPSKRNTLDYITIATTGNATDFGDLTEARVSIAACSSAHGGLS